MRFDLNILGCSGAVPAYGRFPTMQLLNVQERLYMIDCGEGAQIRFSDFNVKWGKLSHIFISHHHGDHVLGLPGLLSSMGLNHRTAPLLVFGPPKVGQFLEQACAFTKHLSFPVHFHEVDPALHKVVFENKALEVYTLPLRHSVPATGYLFREKERPRSMRGEQIERYNIPYTAIPDIKAGADFLSPDHGNVPNEVLTLPPPRSRSFAFCSDTAYEESLLSYIYGVDLLYHESTFLQKHHGQALETGHSTVQEAAMMARNADVRTLVLGHYSTRYPVLDRVLQEAIPIFPNTILGSDGLIVPLMLNP
ncbi:MAG: ribonuclease Z [Phaeodactylibacter sp.]|uniref:ribonuclease Z n=1 Tax=Phaeodactylibacter sp. TaxID=1940289 RepID=UPI0032EB89DD